MQTKAPWSAALMIVMTMAGCGEGPTAVDAERGGKADEVLVGSCNGLTEGQAPDGTCWCDTACEHFGDCCEDYVAILVEEPWSCDEVFCVTADCPLGDLIGPFGLGPLMWCGEEALHGECKPDPAAGCKCDWQCPN